MERTGQRDEKRNGKSERQTSKVRGVQVMDPPQNGQNAHTSFVPVVSGASNCSQHCIPASHHSHRHWCLCGVDDKLLFRIIFKVEELIFESQNFEDRKLTLHKSTS